MPRTPSLCRRCLCLINSWRVAALVGFAEKWRRKKLPLGDPLQMPVLTAAEIAALPWCDATFAGFYWQTDSETPTLILHLTPSNQSACMVACEWACHLEVKLDYGRHVGRLLTGNVAFKKLEDSRWSVHVDLPAQGYIRFEANELRLVPVA